MTVIHRISTIFLDMNIRKKVLAIFILIGGLPFLCYIIISNQYTNRIIMERERSLTERSFEQALSSVKNRLDTYNTLSNFMFNNTSILKALDTNYKTDYFKMYKTYQDTIEPLFLTYYALYPDLKSITIYSSSDLHPYNNYVQSLDNLFAKEWYPKVHNQYIPTWITAMDGGKQYLYSSRIMGDMKQSNSKNYLSFQINYDSFFAPFFQISEDEYGVLITDQDGESIFSTSDMPAKEITSLLSSSTDTEYLQLHSTLSDTGWNVCYYKNYTSMHKAVNAITRGIYTLGWIILLLLGVMLLTISRAIVAPIEMLTAKMGNVRSTDMTDLPVFLDSQRNDEIGALFHNFSSMMSEINHYIEGNLKNEIEKKNYQQKILYAQINPHFLYNALSLINSKAILSSQDEISHMVLLLSRFYQTALNKGLDITTLENELINIQSYIKIQLLSYSEQIEVNYEIDYSLYDMECPNFILQPLVENALDHGLKNSINSDKRLSIIVTKDTAKKEYIMIRIEDNGCGMDKETVENLFQTQISGYGLKNVNDRLRLLYGDDYSLTIDSELQKGTIVILKVTRCSRLDIN